MRLIKTILLTVVGLIAVLAIVVIATLRPNLPESSVELTPAARIGRESECAGFRWYPQYRP